MQIGKKSAVAIDYKLTIEGGIVVDASEKGQPLWYLHGANNIIPGLEKALAGLKVGDKKTVVVDAAEGYGVREDARVHTVPKAKFPPGSYSVGDHVTATAPDGNEMDARITAMDGKTYTTTNPTPQASCLNAGSYRPFRCAGSPSCGTRQLSQTCCD